MRVLFVSAEVTPFAKAGGLADVALALPKALHALGADVRVVMPKYRRIADAASPTAICRTEVPLDDRSCACVAMEDRLPGSSVPIYFLENDAFFDRPEIYGEGSEYPDALARFAFLSRGALQLCEEIDWIPDVAHANDWHTCLISGFLADGAVPRLGEAKTILTIHNLGYQGVFPSAQQEVPGLSQQAMAPFLQNGRINLLKGGILTFDLINTVSETYAKEILVDGAGLEDELGMRREDLYGVINGVDGDVWNPKTDKHLWATYDAGDLTGKAENKARLQAELGLEQTPETPLLGVISRLAEQKGFDLIMEGFDRMMDLGVQLTLLGTGDPEYEAFFREAQNRYPGRVSAQITFSEAWAHRIEAAADAFLMPSHYEPSGLNQQYSLLYGTVPIVRATGGLVDTVQECDAAANTGTGFLFKDPTAEAFLAAVRRAVTLYREDPSGWTGLVDRGMRQDLSWQKSAEAYLGLYERLLG